MTDPIRPTSPNASARPPSSPATPPPPNAPAAQALARPTGLDRPRQASTAAEGASSARRARAAAPNRAGGPGRPGRSQAAAGSSRPSTPSAQLADLAQRLAGLDKRRAEITTQLAKAKEANRKAAAAGGNASNRAEIAKLQDRLDRAGEALQRQRTARAEQIGRLERAERLLASCERSLKGLSLEEAAPQPAAPRESVPSAAIAPSAAVTVPARMSAEEAAAREEVQRLTRELQLAGSEQAKARQALAESRSQVAEAHAAVQAILDPGNYVATIDRQYLGALGTYLRVSQLPPLNQLPAAGQPDARHEQYLAQFTELDDQGARRLNADAVAQPRRAFSAFSALYSAMSPSHVLDSLLANLLREHRLPMATITAALQDEHADLAAVVRPFIEVGLANLEASSRLVGASVESTARGRRHGSLQDTNMRRSEMVDFAQRNRELAQILDVPEHRAAILEGAVTQAAAALRSVAQDYARAAPLVAQLEEKLKQTKAAQRPAFQRSVDAERALDAAREKVRTLADERKREEAAAAKAAAQARVRTSDASIPQTETASSSSGTDAESRRLKLRGDLEKHTEAAEAARHELARSDEQIRQAEADVRRAEDQLETASAAQARRSAGARRQHGRQREELTQLRRELAEVDAGIAAARDEMHNAPSRQALISDRAWERAIERHVEPDDAALRARSRITGYAGAYHSHADLAQASADIHAHLAQQPQFQAVLAATRRADFERAAAALPGGVTDLVHDHGRPVGRGFSNDLDQTERATELTRSSFSLQFVQGRVVISHLYPYVPHRQLTTAV